MDNKQNILSLIKLIAPTTDDERLQNIIKISSGFLYQVNVSGVTGVKEAKNEDVNSFIKRIKRLTDLPVCSGFGIKTPEDAKNIAKSKWLIGCKKKHKDDLAPLEMLISFDDCEQIKKIGNWEIELTPDNNFIQENNYPDWYGYQKIDEK